MSCKQPSESQLVEIITAVGQIIEVLRDVFPDELGAGILAPAAQSLEALLNPNHLAYGELDRYTMHMAGWPYTVGAALMRLRDAHDRLLSMMKWTPMAENKGTRNVWGPGELRAAVADVMSLLGEYESAIRILNAHAVRDLAIRVELQAESESLLASAQEHGETTTKKQPKAA
jgi:hypothetical protein